MNKICYSLWPSQSAAYLKGLPQLPRQLFHVGQDRCRTDRQRKDEEEEEEEGEEEERRGGGGGAGERERERERERAVFRNRNLCWSVVYNNGLHRSCDYSCYAIVCALMESLSITLPLLFFFIWIRAENISAKMSNGKQFQLIPKWRFKSKIQFDWW